MPVVHQFGGNELMLQPRGVSSAVAVETLVPINGALLARHRARQTPSIRDL